MKAAAQSSYLGKYREIVLAVAFFLVFDLAVLVLNFYISFQISQDALSINLAGRQRMLSQRMTKELLAAQSDVRLGVVNPEALVELGKTVGLFDTTLTRFEHGGEVSGGDGRAVKLAAVESAPGRELLANTQTLWQPFKRLLDPLLAASAATPETLDVAVAYARSNNLALLGLMNKLTTHLEETASAKADLLRTVQTGGILLALLNFGFILFKFVRRLQQNDRQVESAQRETTEILDTVKEGLFLLDAEFRVGSQYSTSLPQILGRAVEPGSDFRLTLQSMVPAAVFGPACDYIGLLLGDRVKESLITDLNPLTAVEVAVAGTGTGAAAARCRYLTLQFNRAMKDGKVSHLLVTVSDVTTQVELEQALKEARNKARAEVEVMLDLLKVEPAPLQRFLGDTETKLMSINDQLRGVRGPQDYSRMIGLIFREIHTIKGEAATLGLAMFEDLAQQFEAALVLLRGKAGLSGDDVMSLPLRLDDFLKRIASVRSLSARLAAHHEAFASGTDPDDFAQQLETLAQRIARDQGKEVSLVAELGLIDSLPQSTRSGLKDIAVQLLRNAVVHGIEPAEVRTTLAKPAAGSIHIELKPADKGEYELLLRDDGRGLVPRRIREALLSAGRYTEQQLLALSDRQVLMTIFEPGFTTSEHSDRDSGHGVGMDVVKQRVQQLSGALRLTTRENIYTQFSIRFRAATGLA